MGGKRRPKKAVTPAASPQSDRQEDTQGSSSKQKTNSPKIKGGNTESNAKERQQSAVPLVQIPEELTVEEIRHEQGEPSGSKEDRASAEAPTVQKDARTANLWSDLFSGNREGANGLKLGKIEGSGDVIELTKEDVETEARYWQFSLAAYILGRDVPVYVMVNFLKARWAGIEMPRVVKHEKGFFILRFEEEAQMQAAIRKGNLFFYSKPVILKRWKEGDDLSEPITIVPVWIQLPNLPLEMWGASSLSKITSRRPFVLR